MLLSDMLKQISGFDWSGKPDVHVSGIAFDSRMVQPGDLFVAIKGEKTDGARFVDQAIAKGAVAAASESSIETKPSTACFTVPDARRFLADISRVFYQDPSSKLKLVGITGTNGKTTTSYLLNSLFSQAGISSCLVGTIGMKIGSHSYPSNHTTPEASDLMKFLRQAFEQGCTHGAMEVSSHSLALKRVFGVKFAAGIFMNLTQDHLDFHKDMENYFQAKELLFSRENGNRIETAVINTDDPYGVRLSFKLACPVMRFGFNQAAEIRVLDFHSDANSSKLILATPAGELQLRMQLIGIPNAYNIMAATGAALCLGMNLDQIRNGLEALTGVPGRLEVVNAGQNFTVIVDYAHSPDALENLLQTVSRLPHSRIITVFGCGGDRDRTKRPIMGEIASRKSDLVIATSDNPRSEDPLDILKEIEFGLHKGSAPFKILPDRKQAIEAAIAAADEGDIVVLAGKGHEDYQIIGTQIIPFDDRDVARNLIEKRATKGVH
jgi:UDP-N-acetylmuramoyl-L-alanyl-D-glutamate--2,6-diaminopimelate ligase